jgi:hypothetical protein
MASPVAHELAQINIARLAAPLDSPQLADFVAGLEPVNAVADSADGFRWRLQSEGGDATDIQVFGDAWLIVNMSVWRDIDSLKAYMYDGLHRDAMRRRREWFVPLAEATTALWWVPAGHRPTVAEAEQRLLHLREHGPTPYAFILRQSHPAPAPVPVQASAPGDVAAADAT